ncbi:DUF6504 family protein [Nocardioides sp. InS609-2]|uniref:DUF6504 family protein n=1 Tax=Nocardioides sp. InS609-2 TaxID=2760705 RepID=UPI0020C109D6|nr:DUF6504 family protein [Nocardioides sp. InS609-2]
MRRYDDPVEVRRGRIGGEPDTAEEGPEQFLWRGRLWKVRSVVAHWVETAPWWQSAGVRAVVGTDDGPGIDAGDTVIDRGADDLLIERELWRVHAGRGSATSDGGGVFDLSFDWSDGRWSLVGCVD